MPRNINACEESSYWENYFFRNFKISCQSLKYFTITTTIYFCFSIRKFLNKKVYSNLMFIIFIFSVYLSNVKRIHRMLGMKSIHIILITPHIHTCTHTQYNTTQLPNHKTQHTQTHTYYMYHLYQCPSTYPHPYGPIRHKSKSN